MSLSVQYWLLLGAVTGLAIFTAKFLVRASISSDKRVEEGQGEPCQQHVALAGDYDDSPVAQRLYSGGVDFYFLMDDGLGEGNSAAEPCIPAGRVVVTGLWGSFWRGHIPLIAELRAAGYLQRVTHIDIASFYSNAGLVEIGNFLSLTSLEIENGDSLTDECVAEVFGRLTHLESLIISLVNMTDAAFSTTPNLKQLSFVNVSYTALTDRGLLNYLCQIPNLQKLNVSNTHVSAAGILAAQKLRPDVEILHDIHGI